MNHVSFRHPHQSLAGGREAGLAAFMTGVHGWMGGGLALSGIFAWGVGTTPTMSRALIGSPISIVVMLATFAAVFALSSRAHVMAPPVAKMTYVVYSALTGVTLSTLFRVYTQGSLARAFFITAIAYGALATFGATTKRDLSAVARGAMLALVGLLAATVINLFLRSSALEWMTSLASVGIFSVFSVTSTYQLRQMYAQQGDRNNLTILGALQVHINFVNLFLSILRLTESERRN